MWYKGHKRDQDLFLQFSLQRYDIGLEMFLEEFQDNRKVREEGGKEETKREGREGGTKKRNLNKVCLGG